MKRCEYFYLIRHKQSGKFYAGSCYAKSRFIHPDQFWNENWYGPGKAYFTSSKEIKRLRLAEGNDAFETCYISIRTNEDARIFEHLFLYSIDARRNSDWFNKTNGDEKFICDNYTHEHRRKISNALTGRKLSVEHIANMTAAKIGRIVSPETKIKLSHIHLGKSKSEDTKMKISNSMKGNRRSEETKMKISAARTGKKFKREKLITENV